VTFHTPSKGVGDGFPGCFVAWFIFCAALAVAVVGVLGWAVIALVNHFTA
jgi:hypothetical protein